MDDNITKKYLWTPHSKTNSGAHFPFGIKVMEKRKTSFASMHLGSWLKTPPIIKSKLTEQCRERPRHTK